MLGTAAGTLIGMDTDVVKQLREGLAPGGATAGTAPGTPEATIDEVDLLLDEVEAALTRLDEGTYGECAACGGPIDDGELSADPTVRTCARCGPEGLGGPPGTADGPVERSESHPEPVPSPWSAGAREPVPEV